MSNDKTLATVKHGGCVQLGDWLPPCPFCGHSDLDKWPCEYIDASGANVVRCAHCHAAAPMKVWHSLSAQPSPGGQGDAQFVPPHCQNSGSRICLAAQRDGVICPDDSCDIDEGVRHDDIAARQPVGVDAATLRVLSNRWANDRNYTGSPVDDIRALIDEPTPARQPVGEPVAVVGADFTLFWAGSGPIAPLVERHGIKPDSKLYAAPPAQAVDLGGIPEGWRLSKKATCYQLSHGNDIIGNLVGPDAEENAAIIARALDSQAVGK